MPALWLICRKKMNITHKEAIKPAVLQQFQSYPNKSMFIFHNYFIYRRKEPSQNISSKKKSQSKQGMYSM